MSQPTGFGALTTEDLRTGAQRATDAHLTRLRPEVAARARRLLERAAAAGILLCLTQGFRSHEQQETIYAKGRTAKSDVPCRHGSDVRAPGTCEEHPLGATVTQSRAGFSWHNHGCAFDVAILDARGQPSWPEDDALWRRIGEIGEDTDLQWGGRWKHPDRPHFQMTFGLTLAMLRSGDQVLPPVPEEEPSTPRAPSALTAEPATASPAGRTTAKS